MSVPRFSLTAMLLICAARDRLETSFSIEFAFASLIKLGILSDCFSLMTYHLMLDDTCVCSKEGYILTLINAMDCSSVNLCGGFVVDVVVVAVVAVGVVLVVVAGDVAVAAAFAVVWLLADRDTGSL